MLLGIAYHYTNYLDSMIERSLAEELGHVLDQVFV
jgi:hypothetical protein